MLLFRKLGCVASLLAVLSMSLLQVVVTTQAAEAAGPSTPEQMLRHAQRGTGALLTPAQMATIAQTNGVLHQKLVTARAEGRVPVLTSAERRMVRAMTAQNLRIIKAGQTQVGVVTPKKEAPAATSPGDALTACVTGFTTAGALGAIGAGLAIIVCALLFIPLIIAAIGLLFPKPASS
jgi:hypothetical protein